MNSSALETAIDEAQSINNTLKAGAIADFPEKAKSARMAAKALDQALTELESVSIVPVKYYIALQQANEDVLAALNPDGQAYSEDEMKRVKGALDLFQGAAEKFKEINAVIKGAWKAEPLLSTRGKIAVGIAAVVLLFVGAISAAIGSGVPNSPATILSKWLAFASFALAVVWLFAYLTVRRPSARSVGTAKLGSNQQYIVFGGMGFLVLGLLVAGVLQGGLLEFLSSVSGARGLITFLIAIGTIAIAVILTLAAVIMEANDTDVLKERLSKGKEILTVLVGVLGTIVGFYFASNTDGSVVGKMTVAVVDAQKSVEAGADFTILAVTTGGELPYDSTPIITAIKGLEGEGTVNEQGVIKMKFRVAPDVVPGTMAFVVGLRDKSGKTATAKATIDVIATKSAEKK
jgi:hypothetical protein